MDGFYRRLLKLQSELAQVIAEVETYKKEQDKTADEMLEDLEHFLDSMERKVVRPTRGRPRKLKKPSKGM
jgi:uncharacterized protein Yka (UPF0111/DUF47 family)